MKYEIITDSEDLLVLVVNSRVILITHDISEINNKLTEDYTEFMNKKRKSAERKKLTEEEPYDIPSNIKEPDVGSLGKLFSL